MTVTNKRLTTPADIVLLKLFLKAPALWRDADDVKMAVNWLAHRCVQSSKAWPRLRLMEELGLVEGRPARAGRGREWRLIDPSLIKTHTAGLDPKRLDREEIIELEDRAITRDVEFSPHSYRLARTPQKQVERALAQCPSPWEYGQRLSTINFTNPDL
jgi:hypothetical protein